MSNFKLKIVFSEGKLRNLKFVNHKFLILFAIILLAAILRFYKLGSNPPGLYWDEAVFGYDAYSILKTGQDHHGNFLPLFFESFGDWKLPVYHYLLVPSIAIFGLSEFAVRFPSAFFGTLTVLLTYFLVQKLFENQKLQFSIYNFQFTIAHVSALMLAISPWHIQFSRGGFESTVGLFFVTAGIYLLLLGIKTKKTLLLTFAFLLLTLSMYTYHAYRIFTPLLLLAVIFIYFGQLKKIVSKLIIPILLTIIFLWPLVIFTFSPQGRARAMSQSALKKEEFENARLDFDQKSKKSLRFLSRYWYPSSYFSYIAFNNYIDHFSPVFLFVRGDSIGRHSQVDMGQIYAFDVLLLIAAFFAAKTINQPAKRLILAWLILAPIPATIVTPTPHAYRTLQMVIPLSLASGLGAYWLFTRGKLQILRILILVIIFYSFLTYAHLLFNHYPKKFAADWQDGYKQMVIKVKKYQDNFDKVYITNINQVPYIYLLFYQQYDPAKFIKEQGTRESFDKYVFISPQENIYDKVLPAGRQGRLLYVAPSWQKVDGNFLASVDDSNGHHLYSLWEVNGQN